jgi:hypothetical protein
VAERLEAAEREEVRGFVRWLYEYSGKRRWADFARLTEVSEYSLSEWRSGRGMPNALNLLRMLEAVSALSPEASQALSHARESAQSATAQAEGLPRVPRRRGQ